MLVYMFMLMIQLLYKCIYIAFLIPLIIYVLKTLAFHYPQQIEMWLEGCGEDT